MNASSPLDLSVAILGTGYMGKRYLNYFQGKVRRLILCSNDTNTVKALAPALYFLLMRHFPGDNSLRGNGPRMEFFKIAEYISAHLSAPLTVQSIAKALYISRGRLTSVFTQYAGISPLEYIHSLRIQKANALMDQGRTVTDAALESGFQCIRTFNSTYKHLTEITPSEYLQNKR